jgi:hypothetical protein
MNTESVREHQRREVCRCQGCGTQVPSAAASEIEDGRGIPALCQECIGHLSDVASMSHLWEDA